MPPKPGLRDRNRERTRPACEFGRRARTFVTHSSRNFRREKVCETNFSARRQKARARGTCSPERATESAFDFGIRVEVGKHRTSNAQHRTSNGARMFEYLDVRRSMFDVPPKFNPGLESRLQAVLARCRPKAKPNSGYAAAAAVRRMISRSDVAGQKPAVAESFSTRGFRRRMSSNPAP